MSFKRQATTELNHDNWNIDDPSEPEERGTFQAAPKEVLEKRVIRTAKRRALHPSGDQPKTSVFSGFGGFNKTQPSSFDFLSKLTNGNKINGSSEKGEAEPSSNVSSDKPPASPAGIFGIPSSTPASKPSFGFESKQGLTIFGGSGSSITTPPQGSPFKMNTLFNSTEIRAESTSTPKLPKTNSEASLPSKSLFGANTDASTLFKTTNSSTTPKVQENEKKDDKSKDEKKMRYYSKLKGLNESVSDWIKKHVEETPLCILSPIFKDYEKYLEEIQAEYHGTDDKITENKPAETKSAPSKTVAVSVTETSNTSSSSLFGVSNPKPGLFGSTSATAATEKPSMGFSFGVTGSNSSPAVKPTNEKPSTGFGFGIAASNSNTAAKPDGKLSGGFSFGVNTSGSTDAKPSNDKSPAGFSFGSNTATMTTSGGFSFGLNSSSTTTTSVPSSFATNTSTTSNGSAPFSFGIGKPFSFSSNIQTKSEDKKEENEDEDAPPKVEFTPVVEENSVFDKKCKIFVKKDGNFVDKGVGTLYVKKVDDSGKHQLLVRANTNLGTVLLNFILSSGIPTQRLGKNNVMLVCIPTPEHQPPPTPVLIRVKTSDEADELLGTLDKFKS